jgi:hypothetical protein
MGEVKFCATSSRPMPAVKLGIGVRFVRDVLFTNAAASMDPAFVRSVALPLVFCVLPVVWFELSLVPLTLLDPTCCAPTPAMSVMTRRDAMTKVTFAMRTGTRYEDR